MVQPMSKQQAARQARGWTVVALAALVGVAACSDLMGNKNGEPTTLTFRSTGGARASVGVAGVAGVSLAAIPVTGNGHTVDVQQVDATFDKVKLERVHRSGEEDSDAENEQDSDSKNDEAFGASNITVALPLDSGSVSPITQEIPAGTYDELQLRARALRVRGTYDGQVFDVTVPVNAKIETKLEPPFTVTSSTDRPNITVKIEVPAWFRNADGSVVDPRRLTTDESQRQAFVKRVRASFRSFKDKDRDGVDSDSR
jgi:hypothetical protein